MGNGGESYPEGCAACSEEFNPQNAYRNGTLYSSYTAASFAPKHDLAEAWGINFRGAVTWAQMEWIKIKDGEAVIDFQLPRQGVSLLKILWN